MKKKLSQENKWKLANKIAGKMTLQAIPSQDYLKRLWRIEMRLRAESAPERYMRDDYEVMLNISRNK